MIKIRNFLIWSILIIFLLILANMVYLDYKILRPTGESLFPKLDKTRELLLPSPTPVVSGLTRSEIEDIIKEATSSIKFVAQKEERSTRSSNSGAREFTVHLGSGSSNANDWTDIPGVEAYIDSTKYGRIKNVVFEASLYTPTGNQTAWARLFNVTDKHMVWPSEVSISGGEAKLLVSEPITLDSGNKLYRVQMKTQLKSTTYLVQARVKITIE